MPVQSRKDLKSQGGSEEDLSAVHRIEHAKIMELIKEEAVHAVSRPGIAQQAMLDEARKPESIIAIKNKIRAIYHPDNRFQREDQPKFESAKKNYFQNNSPTTGTVSLWGAVVVIAVAVELAVILALSFMEGELSILPIILASALAGGAFMAGRGIGQLLFNHYVDDQLKKGTRFIALSEKITSSTVLVNLLIGLLLVVGCSYFRYSMADNDINAGGITFGLGLFIMVSEANAYKVKNVREKLMDGMFEAQVYYAVDEHNKFNSAILDTASFDSTGDPCALAYLQALRRG